MEIIRQQQTDKQYNKLTGGRIEYKGAVIYFIQYEYTVVVKKLILYIHCLYAIIFCFYLIRRDYFISLFTI